MRSGRERIIVLHRYRCRADSLFWGPANPTAAKNAVFVAALTDTVVISRKRAPTLHRYTALRWNVVFFVPANESLALNDAADAPGPGFAPLFLLADFSRAACSFCAARPRPPTFTLLALGTKSLMHNLLTPRAVSACSLGGSVTHSSAHRVDESNADQPSP